MAEDGEHRDPLDLAVRVLDISAKEGARAPGDPPVAGGSHRERTMSHRSDPPQDNSPVRPPHWAVKVRTQLEGVRLVVIGLAAVGAAVIVLLALFPKDFSLAALRDWFGPDCGRYAELPPEEQERCDFQ
jgi:hypothetical protein